MCNRDVVIVGAGCAGASEYAKAILAVGTAKGETPKYVYSNGVVTLFDSPIVDGDILQIDYVILSRRLEDGETDQKKHDPWYQRESRRGKRRWRTR